MLALKPLLDILCRNTRYTQFLIMLVANVAIDRETCDELCDLGVVQGLMGFCISTYR